MSDTSTSPFVNLDLITPDWKSWPMERVHERWPQWYYQAELKPGEFSRGQKFSNVGLTRAAVHRTSVAGQRCLDIGCMEGLISIVMERQGAKEVVAYDRPAYFQEQVGVLKSAYESNFHFVNGIRLSELRPTLTSAGIAPFDVVVFSGVMYHMLDPLAGLAAARSLVRNGGILIVETAATIDHRAIFVANTKDRFGGHSYLLGSPPLLEYFARMLRLQILDCEYHLSHQEPAEGVMVCRLCFVARASETSTLAADDPFLNSSFYYDQDVAEFVDWSAVESAAPPVPYRNSDIVRYGVEQDKAIDLLSCVLGNKPRSVDSEDCILRLNDTH